MQTKIFFNLCTWNKNFRKKFIKLWIYKTNVIVCVWSIFLINTLLSKTNFNFFLPYKFNFLWNLDFCHLKKQWATDQFFYFLAEMIRFIIKQIPCSLFFLILSKKIRNGKKQNWTWSHNTDQRTPSFLPHQLRASPS